VTSPPASGPPEDAPSAARSDLPVDGDGEVRAGEEVLTRPPATVGPFGGGEPVPDGDQPAPEAAGEPVAAGKRRARKGSSRSFWKELPILIVVALVVAVLIKTFLVQAFYIPSGSMNDTLLEGDRVMVNKLAYRFGDPARGDVVVFDSPMEVDADGETIFGAVVRHVAESLGLSSPDSALIKRIIALGGETLEVRENRVYVDGSALDEPYLKEGSWMPDYGPVTVPEGQVFVMGDNRSSSSDSRVFGPISEDEIVGKAFVRVWPPSRWGGL
jgi:signal peptidase I